MSQNSKNNGGMAAKAAQLAQLARGVTETIRGAMAGGLYGAAIAAAKAFTPQIIKIIAIIILALLLLPTIIFFALPNMLWQWPSSNDAEITAIFSFQNIPLEMYYHRYADNSASNVFADAKV